jgi:hypothetical protein
LKSLNFIIFKKQLLINHLMDDQHFSYITKLKKKKEKRKKKSWIFLFSFFKSQIWLNCRLIYDHILYYITKLEKKQTKTHMHTFTSFAFSKWHNTWPHLWEHEIPHHQSIKHIPLPSHSSNLRRNGWKFHVNGWNLTYMKRGKRDIEALNLNTIFS